jgi:hypothetical protein
VIRCSWDTVTAAQLAKLDNICVAVTKHGLSLLHKGAVGQSVNHKQCEVHTLCTVACKDGVLNVSAPHCCSKKRAAKHMVLSPNGQVESLTGKTAISARYRWTPAKNRRMRGVLGADAGGVNAEHAVRADGGPSAVEEWVSECVNDGLSGCLALFTYGADDARDR